MYCWSVFGFTYKNCLQRDFVQRQVSDFTGLDISDVKIIF